MLDRLETELKLRGFSDMTVRTYVKQNKLFLDHIKKNPEDVTEEDIRGYLASQMSEHKSAIRTISLKKAALKFFYDELLKKGIVNLKTPKTPKDIPDVLTKDEVKALIDNAGSKKTKLIIQFLYSTGLRVSELVGLKKNNLNLKEGEGWVRAGKGNKDRFFKIPDSLKGDLELFIKELETEYLFAGKNGHISTRNIQKILQSAGQRAGINKRSNPHQLRHAYATHLLNSGVDIRLIQELLGHSSLSTTQLYTHVSKEQLKKIKSPLDSL